MTLPFITISLLVTFVPFSLLPKIATSIPVYDINGEALTLKSYYYILPAIRGDGGGIDLYFNLSCPYVIAQRNIETLTTPYSDGIPVRFDPVNPNEETIPLSTDLKIEFNETLTLCGLTSAWWLSVPSSVTGLRYVVAGGDPGNPGRETSSNWFRIENLGSKNYKIMFCPSVCDTCNPVCGNVGVIFQGNVRFFGLYDVPFPVVFKKTD